MAHDTRTSDVPASVAGPDGYTIRKALSVSARTVVCHAVEDETGHAVILKIPAAGAESPEVRARYEKEHAILSSQVSPSIVAATALLIKDKTPILVLEDSVSSSLCTFLSSRSFDLAERLAIATQMTAALAAVHDNGVIHGNVNTSNFIINPQTLHLRIIDFSQGVQQGFETQNETDEQHDLFRLGLALYELFTGRPCSDDETLVPPPLTELNPQLPGAVSEIVLRATSQNPDASYQSAAAVHADLIGCGRRLARRGIIDPISNTPAALTEIINPTPRQVLSDKLRRAREAATTASMERSAFLSRMSYEMRAPLNAILGFTQELRIDPDLGEKARGQIDTIYRSSEHLLDIIHDVLEMSRLEGNRLKLLMGRIDLHRTLAEIHDAYGPRAAAKGILVNQTISDQVPRYVRSDPRKVQQILTYLVDNAIETTSQGIVEISVQSESLTKGNHLILVAVADTGPGIPKAQLERVFEPFEQILSGDSHKGTGLGMPLCREFARLMGGDITLQSEEGKGCTFTFSFEALAVESFGVDPAEQFQNIAELTPSTIGTRVLIVDDAAGHRGLYETIIGRVGFAVKPAASTSAGLEAFDDFRPDVILLKQQMNLFDFEETVEDFRMKPHGPTTPIIAISASASEDERLNALAAGADGFLCKPIIEEEVFSEIRRVVDVNYLLSPPELAQFVELAPRGGVPLWTLPSDTLHILKEAAELEDITVLLGIIDRLALKEPSIAESLRNLAIRYEFEKLIILIEAALDSRG